MRPGNLNHKETRVAVEFSEEVGSGCNDPLGHEEAGTELHWIVSGVDRPYDHYRVLIWIPESEVVLVTGLAHRSAKATSEKTDARMSLRTQSSRPWGDARARSGRMVAAHNRHYFSGVRPLNRCRCGRAGAGRLFVTQIADCWAGVVSG